MSEKKERSSCCEGFCFELKKTDHGIAIQITGSDCEKIEALQKMAGACCPESSGSSCAPKSKDSCC